MTKPNYYYRNLRPINHPFKPGNSVKLKWQLLPEIAQSVK